MKTKHFEFTESDLDFLKARAISGESSRSSGRQEFNKEKPAGKLADSKNCRPLDLFDPPGPGPVAGRAYGCLSGNRYEVNTQNYDWWPSERDRAEVARAFGLPYEARPDSTFRDRALIVGGLIIGALAGFGFWW